MNKVYSNKALPPGTVLREWRLEEVLGVGGFGIVYKGRGIWSPSAPMSQICGIEQRRVLVSSSFLRHYDETKALYPKIAR